jgi:uncharacterized protein
VFGGLLCTIDVRNDPIDTYRALVAWRPPTIDFLLPHGNWSEPPPGRADGDADVPYADWLIRIFEHWYGAVRLPVQIRLFQEIMHLALGGDSVSESLGLAPTRVVVIETDGAIEQSDSLKSTFPGAPRTGLHVTHDRLEAALEHPGIVRRQAGSAALAAACQSCDVQRICGGGLYAHRYRAENGFANPSVYCPDLLRLIRHISGRLARDLAHRRTRTGPQEHRD